MRPCRAALVGLVAVAASAATPAPAIPLPSGSTTPVSGQEPVTFQADAVTYDRTRSLVTASGHVQAWQNGHLLRADSVTFDRTHNVAAATGHVVIVEPDGEVVFADYAELTGGMKDGVMVAMRSLLTQNGKLAANGARRVEGKLNQLSRAVYSACDLCAANPLAPPLWQIKARRVTQDLEHKRIEYSNAWLQMDGWPVMYFPYLSQPDPSVPRATGLLIPTVGFTDKHLGSFFTLPYYIVLNRQSDLTVTPLIATQTGPQLEANYRLRLNNGEFRVLGAIADDAGLQGLMQAHGLFAFNDTWRYGFDINAASSAIYMRDFHLPGYGQNVLASSVFAEGFGVGAYSILSLRGYQGLNSSVAQTQLPYVLPFYHYNFWGRPDALGGRTEFDLQAFNVLRQIGTNDSQLGTTLRWDRPFAGAWGDRWRFTAYGQAVAYDAKGLDKQPNYDPQEHGTGATGQAELALKLNWPLVRDAGGLGSQIVEPILQVIAAPQAGNGVRNKVPNEDALDYEFTDETLFSLNRFEGLDRFEGGVRVNAALHASWLFPGGQVLDGLVGQSYREHVDHPVNPEFGPLSGIGGHASDYVGRISLDPNPWLDFTARTRLDRSSFRLHFADAVAEIGKPILRVYGGFLYSNTNPYLLYEFDPNNPTSFNPRNPFLPFYHPRDEVTAGFSTKYGRWSASLGARRNLSTGQMVSAAADAKYEDECFIFDLSLQRRFTSLYYDRGNTTVLLTFTFKTVGSFPLNTF